MPRSILVADDDRSMLNLYNKIFARTDYSVSMAGSFEEAFRLIGSRDYDLLITDFLFPDGLGTELIKAFCEKKAGAKSFLVTGAGPAASRQSCPGMAALFEKPFNVDRFMSAVAEALA